jgi:hypothetical protein
MTTPINLDSNLPSDEIQKGKQIELESSSFAVLPTKESDGDVENNNDSNNDTKEPRSGPTQVTLSKGTTETQKKTCKFVDKLFCC